MLSSAWSLCALSRCAHRTILWVCNISARTESRRRPRVSIRHFILSHRARMSDQVVKIAIAYVGAVWEPSRGLRCLRSLSNPVVISVLVCGAVQPRPLSLARGDVARHRPVPWPRECSCRGGRSWHSPGPLASSGVRYSKQRALLATWKTCFTRSISMVPV